MMGSSKGILMKSPIWILNSTLAVLFLLVLVLILFTQKTAPKRKPLAPDMTNIAPIKKDVSKVNLVRIYESDLFNTYIKPAPPAVEDKAAKPLPQPPLPMPLPTPQPQNPQFLPPLDITLKGIIYTNNDTENRAIIANNKTKQEEIYKVGDKVGDADLIRIGKNKIFLIRVNGQQETIFITAADAQKDPIYTRDASWNLVVRKATDGHYIVDPKSFVHRITNLAQFIDMLDMTTAFEKGKSVGCRIGRMSPQSIGPSLGLAYGDIIISINGIHTTTTKDRVAIYNQIKDLGLDATIKVVVLRQDREVEVVYKLQKIAKTEEESGLAMGTQLAAQAKTTPKTIKNNTSASVLAESSKLNPMAQNLNKRDQHAMLRHGGRGALLSRSYEN